MYLGLQQKPILTQKLIMTPQLQQAIKLLQLSGLELAEKVQQELGENPALEEIEESTVEKSDLDAIDLQNYLDSYSSPKRVGSETEVKATQGFETYTADKATLTDHLLRQLVLTAPTPEEKMIGCIIAGSLDKNGYLKASVEEIAGMSSSPPEKVEQVLCLMQFFDPPGVCARDLRECLLIQARQLGYDNSLITDIIANHLKDLGKKDCRAVCRALKARIEEVISTVNVIKGLEPRPARQFGEGNPQYVYPDIFIYKMEGDFVIVLNDNGMPKLRVSPLYREFLRNGKKTPDKVRDYLLDRVRSAEWMIKSIYQRQRTIYRVVESILKFQRDFFEKGVSHLRPMVLMDVADDIEMAEATVSRVTTNKYVQTPRGIFSLKYFFNSSINRFHGEPLASVCVQEKIKEVIAAEDPKKPFSDDAIAKILKASNIDIARRTVAKYREKMSIFPSNMRKEFL